ncbi:hypothetical protein EMIHUDRAFT_206771 [Emiliania huxleyi CCMP1516]|uniref:Glycosyl hydrolase family 32 N-terminal domain-containing protein n=2 Tax=Emiliania huxleyi TaxID=2903 RepID=A0A0D3JMF1_EMIH1|nr:hypothetical protein EMIHUDRAFT_206771 [Emiliania huxleyi CCMP1516]EOD24686.1 hypothetical protein EMIHUDRAFT_206771 [Emiliania huxleyi CCMP1516]|eukprot:XP_005777115.1 hypothetical protein EMIHUDRAFT_206771 [Emiliania huxleyi CCMP1516]
MTNTSHWRASATVDATPVLSFVDGTSRFQQSFNPAWVAPSASTRWTSGLLVRSQNCSAVAGGRCVACAGSGPRNASALSFSALLSDDNHTSSAPVFAKLSDVVFAPHDAADERGTEDPRLAYDDRTGMYYMFYTAWSASSWTRHGTVFEGPHKSAALLIRAAPPHYLFYGAGEIRVSRSSDLLRWQPGEPFLRGTAWGNANVEAGPPPLRLADGNYVFFFNSWKAAGSAYQPAWAVLDGDDPTRVLASAASPLWSPASLPWMAGAKPYTCNMPQVAFVEAAHAIGHDRFRLYFGGADAVVGSAVYMTG